MKKIIIYGIALIKLRREIEYFLDSEECQIIGYSDSYYQEDVVDHRNFIAPMDICRENVDYIVIATESIKAQEEIKSFLIEQGVSLDKIVIPVMLFSKAIASKARLIDEINMTEGDYDGLIFGLSYSRKGIKKDKLLKRFYDFSKDGLDLYYNAETYKRILEQGRIKNIKCALCMFPYYYFDYDMSKSLGQYESGQIFCVQGLKDWHNYKKCLSAENYVTNFELFGNRYAAFYNAGHWEPIIRKTLSDTEEYQLERIWYRDYDETVDENLQIFESFLKQLKNEKVKVILVVPPICLNIYNEDDRRQIYKKKEKFYRCLEPFIEDKLLEVIDHTDLYIDKLEFFYNPTHLNYYGSEAYTKIINQLIEENK